ncbi:MAG TPA: hypothetical protein VFF22_19495 [Pseudomonas sp.]|nr:hypothetical protein [Pseudomonas sp.]
MLDETLRLIKEIIWDSVKAISTLTAVGIISYKVYLTPIALTVDFPTLLSLLLALFSVALAALFYFKATDTSNTFYDNTYNFTKDIAQLLVKMESGFGEKLRNLDEGYSSMREYLQTYPSRGTGIDDTKRKIEGEKQEIEKVIEERNKIVNDLIEKSQLEQEEKEQILLQLKSKESELEASQKELEKMNKRLFLERIEKKNFKNELRPGLESYTYSHVIEKIGLDRVLHLSSIGLQKRVDALLNELPRQYIEDLERNGYFDNGINVKGVNFIRRLAEKHA